MTERRYGDDEIAAIFSKAAKEEPQLPAVRASREDGLTLAELQAIGRETGIAPDAVARAARSLDARPAGRVRRYLGLPIGVERTVSPGLHSAHRNWRLASSLLPLPNWARVRRRQMEEIARTVANPDDASTR